MICCQEHGLEAYRMPIFGARWLPKLVVDQLLMFAGPLAYPEIDALAAAAGASKGDSVVAASRPQHDKLGMLVRELN